MKKGLKPLNLSGASACTSSRKAPASIFYQYPEFHEISLGLKHLPDCKVSIRSQRKELITDFID